MTWWWTLFVIVQLYFIFIPYLGQTILFTFYGVDDWLIFEWLNCSTSNPKSKKSSFTAIWCSKFSILRRWNGHILLTQRAIFPLSGSILWRFLHLPFVSGRSGCSPSFPGMRIRGSEAAAVDMSTWQPFAAERSPVTARVPFGWRAAGKQVGRLRLICQNSRG